MHKYKINYRPEIDGLRALAVLPVIFFHAGFQPFSGGFVGVDLFFVISGYLISSILIREQEKNEFSVLRFYERRAKRILPALIFVVICCVPLAWAYMLPDELKRFGYSIISVATFSSNVYFWRTTGYFSPSAEEQPLLHTWSLSVEEQFYVLFPLFMMYFWRYGRTTLVWVVILVTASSLVLAEWGSRYEPSASFYMLPTRAWELLFGSLVAFIPTAKLKIIQKRKFSEILALIGICLIVSSIFLFDKTTPFPSVYTLFPVLGAVLIIVFATNESSVGKILSSRPLVGIGLISYSAYLWHQPIFAFIRIQSVDPAPSHQYVIAVFLCLALAWLTWKFIETPFRGGAFAKLATRRILKVSLASLIVLTMSGLVHTNYLAGAKYQQLPQQKHELAKSALFSPYRSKCHKGDNSSLDPSDYCVYPNDTKPKIAVFGDSHAVELAYALGLQVSDKGVAHFSYSACGPLSPYKKEVNTKCEKWSLATQKFIAENPQFETVVVTYRIVAAVCGDHRAIYPKVNDSCRKEKLVDLTSTLNYFIENGKKVILLLQAPELRNDITKLIYKEDLSSNEDHVSVSRAWWISRSSAVYKEIEKQIPSKVQVIDPANWFCDEQNCYATMHDKALYFDDDHMSTTGAVLVSKELAKKL